MTDEPGMAALDKKMHINELHATVLHLLGLATSCRVVNWHTRQAAARLLSYLAR